MTAFPDLVTFTRASVGTYFDKSGVLRTAAINTPRFDFEPFNLAARGLLVESSRTNVCLNSEAITAGTGTAVASNVYTAPDLAATADLLTETAVNSEHYASDFSFTPIAGQDYSNSVFVRQGPGSRNALVRVAGASTASVNFNFATQTVTTAGAQFVRHAVQALPDGWFRITLVWNALAAASTVFRVQIASGMTTIYLGDGTSGFYVWGRQVEQGSFSTSYIATAAGAVTRSPDLPYVANLAPWNVAGRGTLLCDAVYQPNGSVVAYALALGTTSATGERITLRKSGSDTPFADVVDASNVVLASWNLAPAMSFGVPIRIATSYGPNNMQGAARGVVGTRVLTGTPPSAPTRLSLGMRGTSSDIFNGWIRRVRYFPREMTDAELQALTA